MKRKFFSAALLGAALLLGSQSCSKDDKESIKPSGPDPENPENPVTPSKPELSGKPVEVVSVQQAAELVPTVKEAVTLKISENLETKQEELAEVISALAENPEQAKLITLDLTTTNITKFDAQTFARKSTSLSKAGEEYLIMLAQMYLPSTLQEIADGACVNFSGTTFLITSDKTNMVIGEGAFEPNKNFFHVNPKVYYAANAQILSVLSMFGEVTCDWNLYFRGGITLENKGFNRLCYSHQDPHYTSLVLNFVPGSDSIYVYHKYESPDSSKKKELYLADIAFYKAANDNLYNGSTLKFSSQILGDKAFIGAVDEQNDQNYSWVIDNRFFTAISLDPSTGVFSMMPIWYLDDIFEDSFHTTYFTETEFDKSEYKILNSADECSKKSDYDKLMKEFDDFLDSKLDEYIAQGTTFTPLAQQTNGPESFRIVNKDSIEYNFGKYNLREKFSLSTIGNFHTDGRYTANFLSPSFQSSVTYTLQDMEMAVITMSAQYDYEQQFNKVVDNPLEFINLLDALADNGDNRLYDITIKNMTDADTTVIRNLWYKKDEPISISGVTKYDNVRFNLKFDPETCWLTKICAQMFHRCRGMQSIEIPWTVTEISGYAFVGCTGLTKIEIPSSVTKLGGWLFASCENLTEIKLPNTIESYGQCIVGGAGITECPIPDNFTEIYQWYAAASFEITSVTIPARIEKIGTAAFSSCKKLSTVYIEGQTTFGTLAFNSCDEDLVIYVKPELLDWYKENNKDYADRYQVWE